MGFDEKVLRFISKIKGTIISRDVFMTFFGKKAVFIINKVLWHAIRIIIDCE